MTTCRHKPAVLDGVAPVALAARLYSGHCVMIKAVTTDEDDPVVVHFGDLLAHDPTPEIARTLRRGDVIFRPSGAGSGRRRQRFSCDHDYERMMESPTN